MAERMRPGAQYALRLVNFGAPVVRQRYDRGVPVNPDGFPDWEFQARALVELPEPPAGLTVDEIRVVDVLAANALLARDGTDPLWTPGDLRTPPGWTWAHLGGARQLAAVPIELHASFRHAGGVSELPGSAGRGLRVDYQPTPVGVAGPLQRVIEPVLKELEALLGVELPPRYREFLAQTNGATPDGPGVLPGFGFIADQPFFGLTRQDPAEDLVVANQYTGDRFTADFLGIGWVQGGTLAVRLRGEDRDSIWWYDDDDPRADASDDAAAVSDRLLHRCADHVDQFWQRLARPSRALLELAAAAPVRQLRPDTLGDSLPPERRAPWQPPRLPDEAYFGDEAVRLLLLRQDEPA